MKNIYSYEPSFLEIASRPASMKINRGDRVCLAKAPAGGRGLPRRFKWIETPEGEFLGMVYASSLVKVE